MLAKLELQQRQLRDGFTGRDNKIRLLNEALSRALAQAPVLAENASDDARAAKDALVDLDRRLGREVARCERLESRLEVATLARSRAERARHDAEHECESLHRELALTEAQINCWLGEDPKSATPDLDGAQVLYVGGRAHQVPQLKAFVERARGSFLHHDGGIEHSMTLLPGLISRADCAVFPIDCISHDAMGIVKRQCRQSAKPFLPLRTSSLASLLSGTYDAGTRAGAGCCYQLKPLKGSLEGHHALSYCGLPGCSDFACASGVGRYPSRSTGAGSLTDAFTDLLRRFPAAADTIAASEFGPSGLMREKIEVRTGCRSFCLRRHGAGATPCRWSSRTDS